MSDLVARCTCRWCGRVFVCERLRIDHEVSEHGADA